MGTALEPSHSDRRRPPGIPGQLAGAGRPGGGRDWTSSPSHRGARRRQRRPPASPPSSAGRRAEVRKTIKQPREQDAAPSPRAQVSQPRGLAQVQPRGAHTCGEGPRGRRPDPGRPPPRTHQRPLAPRRTRGRLPGRLGRRGAPGARPRPPRPARRAPHAQLPHGPRRAAPAPPRPRLPQAPSCRTEPGTARRTVRTRARAASAPRRRLRSRSRRARLARLQVPAGAARARQRGAPRPGRLPGTRGGGRGRAGRGARRALGPCAAEHSVTRSFRGPRRLAREWNSGVL